MSDTVRVSTGSTQNVSPGAGLAEPPGLGKGRWATRSSRSRSADTLERTNAVMAEITARELGRIDLTDALELTARRVEEP